MMAARVARQTGRTTPPDRARAPGRLPDGLIPGDNSIRTPPAKAGSADAIYGLLGGLGVAAVSTVLVSSENLFRLGGAVYLTILARRASHSLLLPSGRQVRSCLFGEEAMPDIDEFAISFATREDM